MGNVAIVRYHTGEQMVTALRGDPGRKLIPLVMITDGKPGVVCRMVPKHEERHMVEHDYPIKLAVRRFRDAGKRLGITKAAEYQLRAAESTYKKKAAATVPGGSREPDACSRSKPVGEGADTVRDPKTGEGAAGSLPGGMVSQPATGARP